MYEWTTETGKHNERGDMEGKTTYAVLRGGSFANYGSFYPVSIRDGSFSVGLTSPNFGFRVVLYVN